MNEDGRPSDVPVGLVRDEIWRAAQKNFTVGHWDDAVFAAFRILEDSIQSRIGSKSIGGALIDEAFDAGAMTPKINVSPRDTDNLNNFFKGALGLFKGDRSHKARPTLPCPDRQTCIATLALVSLQMDLLDRDRNVAPAIVGVSAVDSKTLMVAIERGTAMTRLLVDGSEVPALANAGESILIAMPKQAPFSLQAVDGRRRSQEFVVAQVPGVGAADNFHRIKVVGISAFADAAGKLPIVGVKAVAVESFESGRFFVRYFPTAKDYQPGDYVTWDWDLNHVTGEAWAPGGKPQMMWNSAAYFAGDIRGHAGSETITSIQLRPAEVVLRRDDRVPLRVTAYVSDGIGTWTRDATSEAEVALVAGNAVLQISNDVIKAVKDGDAHLRARLGTLAADSHAHVGAISSRTKQEYLGGYRTVTSMCTGRSGTFFVHRSNDIKLIDQAKRVRSIASIPVPETSTTGLDMLATAEGDDLIIRTLWTPQIIWIEAAELYRRSLHVAGVPAGKPPTALHWDRRVGLLAAFSDGSIMHAQKGGSLKPWSSAGPLIAGFASTDDLLYAVPAGNAPGFLKFDWDGKLIEHNRDHPELAAISAVAADSRGVFMADFYSGKVYLLTAPGLELLVEGLPNPDALAIDSDGNLLVGCIEGDAIYRVFP